MRRIILNVTGFFGVLAEWDQAETQIATIAAGIPASPARIKQGSFLMGKLHWYKRDPNAALGGMMGLSLEERGAYNTVLDLIYANDDHLVDDDRFLAGWCRCDVRVWKRIKKSLITKMKLTTSDGFLRNIRATSEVSRALRMIEQRQEAGHIGGVKSGAARNKINEIGEAPAEASAEAKDEAKSNTTTTTTTPTTRTPPNGGVGAAVFQGVMEAWNTMASRAGLPAVKTLTDQRRKTLKIRIDEAGGVEPFLAIIAKVGKSPFLTGQNDRNWRADFDFVLRQSAFVKLMEGGYDKAEKVLTPKKTEEWAGRILWARKNQQWCAKWGPRPGEAGCEVPAALVQAGDGVGWSEWQGAR